MSFEDEIMRRANDMARADDLAQEHSVREKEDYDRRFQKATTRLDELCQSIAALLMSEGIEPIDLVKETTREVGFFSKREEKVEVSAGQGWNLDEYHLCMTTDGTLYYRVSDYKKRFEQRVSGPVDYTYYRNFTLRGERLAYHPFIDVEYHHVISADPTQPLFEEHLKGCAARLIATSRQRP